MPELPVIGRADDIAELDIDPVVMPLVGYTLEKPPTEVMDKFKFRPAPPAGMAMEVLALAGPMGEIGADPVARYLDKALLPGERERWHDFLNRDDLVFSANVLIAMFQALTEHYAARPTLQRSASPNGRHTTPRTSRVAARSQASGSKRSR